jgi:hypothetical protein
MGLSDSQWEQYQDAFNTFDQNEEGDNTGTCDDTKKVIIPSKNWNEWIEIHPKFHPNKKCSISRLWANDECDENL